MALAAR